MLRPLLTSCTALFFVSALSAQEPGKIAAIAAPAKPAAPAPKPTPKPDLPPPQIAASELPKDAVRVEIFEFPIPASAQAMETFDSAEDKTPAEQGNLDAAWSVRPTERTAQFTQAYFSSAGLPGKFTRSGVLADRSRLFLVRMAAVVTLPAGEVTLHTRSQNGVRVSLDGTVRLKTPLQKRRGGDLDPVPDLLQLRKVDTWPLPTLGQHDEREKIQSDGQPHVLLIEMFVGGKGLRPEFGELAVSFSTDEKNYQLIGFGGPRKFTPQGWSDFIAADTARVEAANRAARNQPDEAAYWQRRHELARTHAPAAPKVPASAPGLPAQNAVDHFLNEKLAAAQVKPTALSDDAAFLRRATLDTTGYVPTPEELQSFLADPSPDRRARAIERLLADPRRAGHWTSYWQDVLAENPNMLKGTLNNTGPFRWWLHTALSDNLPLDRFITQLVMMEGSANFGGPAGFAIATQNDLPLAAKAQIVSSAFLANEMKCARCHDAPNHPFDQRELFAIAAMLGRAPLTVPETSLTKGLTANSHVQVTLKAGEKIDPHFPFGSGEPLPGVLRGDDSRERLAAALTDPRQRKFAQVMVNRIWARLMGAGIVDPVDDWAAAAPSHPELLDWLAHQLVTHDYDVRHIERLLLNSHAYQRTPDTAFTRAGTSAKRLFAGPMQRRMTAEQLVDSIFAVTGQPLESERLTFDPENRQEVKNHNDLGIPRRAWEFAALSNERDRPALAKPYAATVVDVLTAFGWRESRPEPRTVRDHDANAMQPALLANGTLISRVSRLDDQHAVTAIALQEAPLEKIIGDVFARVLTRKPTGAELEKLTAYLSPGFTQRRTGAEPAAPLPRSTKGLSWASHLNPDATTAALEIEREVKAGHAPTPRLTTDWRDRMEDVLWALLNSPEFLHLP